MAFTVIEGFDLYAGSAAPLGVYGKWQNVSSGGTILLVAGRFAGQAIRLTDGTGSTAALQRTLGAAQTSFSIGFAYKHTNHSAIGAQGFLQVQDAAGAEQFSLFMVGATGEVRIYRGYGTTLLATTPVGTMIEGNWQHFEIRGTIDNAAGMFELYVDGISKATFAGDTQQSALANLQFIVLRAPDGSGSGSQCFFDDFFCNNSNAQVGEMRIDAMRVNSDSAEQDWNPFPASAAYQAIDDNTVSSSDYIQADTVGNLSFFGIEDLSVTPESIVAVQLTSFAVKTDASTRQYKMKTRIGADVQDGPTHTLTATFQPFNAIFETTPTGGDWDATAINNLEIGVEVVT